jgi:hypothetical protein
MATGIESPRNILTHEALLDPPGEKDNNDSKGANVGAIAGGVVGGVAGLAALIAVGILLRRRQKRQQKPDPHSTGDDVHPASEMMDKHHLGPPDASELGGSAPYATSELDGSAVRYGTPAGNVVIGSSPAHPVELDAGPHDRP